MSPQQYGVMLAALDREEALGTQPETPFDSLADVAESRLAEERAKQAEEAAHEQFRRWLDAKRTEALALADHHQHYAPTLRRVAEAVCRQAATSPPYQHDPLVAVAIISNALASQPYLALQWIVNDALATVASGEAPDFATAWPVRLRVLDEDLSHVL